MLCASIFFLKEGQGYNFSSCNLKQRIPNAKSVLESSITRSMRWQSKPTQGPDNKVLIFGGGDPSRPSRNNKPLKLKSEKKQLVYRPWGSLGFISTVNKPQAARMPTYKYQLSLEIIHNIEFHSQEMTDGNKCSYFSEKADHWSIKMPLSPSKIKPFQNKILCQNCEH